MRVVNLANLMDIFRRKPVGYGFPRAPWSGPQWREHSPGLVKIQEKSEVDSPQGLEARPLPQVGPLQRIEMGTLLILCPTYLPATTVSSDGGFIIWLLI